MALSFAVVCEAPADRETACDLSDRVFRESAERDSADWVEDYLEHLRAWRGLYTTTSHITWKDAAKLARAHNITSHGLFNGAPAEPDAHAARKVSRLFMRLSDHHPDAVILIRDADDQENRWKGLEQARVVLL